ncbi:unnamed protein product [Heterobilharzia americana]|nr:unnamed protein product [Heterobilharzia americana]
MIIHFSTYLYFVLCSVKAYTDELVDITFGRRDSAFLISDNRSTKHELPVYFASASNSDRYEIKASIGLLHSSLTILGEKLLENSKLHVTVHTFDSEVSEETKTLHFLCHASYSEDINGLEFEPSSICCVISVNATYFNELTSCMLVIDSKQKIWICRASIKLPPALWKQKRSPEVILSFTSSGLYSFSDAIKRQDVSSDSLHHCHLTVSNLKPSFTPIPSVSIAHLVPDAFRDLGRSLLLQIPRRELKTNEDFFVTVRLKRFDDVSDFTLRCEIPSNTYVEFIQVIWPAGVGTLSSSSVSLSSSSSSLSSTSVDDPNSYIDVEEFLNTQTGSSTSPSSSSPLRNEMKSRNMWDVFHRSVVGPKRNVTEIVARFREDLAETNPSSKYSSATEVYKLQFRVKKPESGSPGRVAPRIFWSLVSLNRRNSPDHAVSASPVVTRLNIEPSELKHITMVLKTSALVNLAVLTGQPTTYPIWVYGLTHDLRLVDITSKATCHTGDDAVIHFAQDMCSKLGFSGAELDGSPGLPLVAKLDGRSATATLLVWFPKAPALKLIVESSPNSNYDSANQELSKVITLKRLATEIIASHSNFRKSLWINHINTTESLQFFQYFRVRILARFILASSVLHDKDVLGGKINQYVDVTEFTAHRLRLEYTHKQSSNKRSLNSGDGNISSMPEILNFQSSARLLTVGDIPLRNPYHNMQSIDINQRLKPLRVWLVGQHPGSVKIHLVPIDRTLINSFIPPGLAKQLKDHIPKEADEQSEADSKNQSQHHYSPLTSDHSLKEPSLTVRVTDDTSIWPVGISAQLVTDFSVFISLQSGMDGMDQGASENFSTSNNVNDIQDNLFTSSSAERKPILSGIYSVHVELKGSKLTHSGSINSAFSQEASDMHRKLSMLSSDHLNRNNVRQRLVQANSVGFLVVWIHLSDGSSVLWNRMAEIYEQLYGKDKIPLNLSVRNCRPDLFWIETNSAGVVERRMRSAKRSSTSSSLPKSVYSDQLENSPLSGKSLLRKSRSVRAKSHLTVSYDPLEILRQRVHRSLSTDEVEKDLSAVNTSNYWYGPVVWFLQKGLKFSGDVLEVGLTSPSGNILVPHVRIHGDIVTPNNGISMNYYIRNRDKNQVDAKTLQEIETGGKNVHGSMAYKDSPGYYSSQPVLSLTETEGRGVKGAPESDYRYSQYSSQTSSLFSTKQKNSAKGRSFKGNSVSINSDANAFIATSSDDTQSILSDVGGGSSPLDNKESAKDADDKHASGLSGSGNKQITEVSDRSNNNSSGARPVLEMSMYILLGLFAVIGLVFAVNCGVVVIRYRWEKMNANNSSTVGAADDTCSRSSTTGSCVQRKRNQSFGRNTPSPSLPLTGVVSNGDDNLEHNEIIPSVSASPKCKWISRSKSGADNHEKLLSTNNHNDYNKNGAKRTKRSATSMFTSRHKHKPLLHRDSSWVWVGRQQVIGEQNETEGENDNLNSYNPHLRYPATSTIKTGNNSYVTQPDRKRFHANKRSVQCGEAKKNSTTAVLSVGEADMLLLQSPYREGVWQDTLPSGANSTQFSYPNETNPTSLLANQLSLALNIPKSECQTLGRQSRRHTTAVTQRNYQGQECSIRIISNPLSDNKKRQQSQNQFNNPQLFLSNYASENMNYTNNASTTLTKSAIVCDSWLNMPGHMMLTGSASASLHRKQIQPSCTQDGYRLNETLCSDMLNCNAFTPNLSRPNNFKNIPNSPYVPNSPHPLPLPSMIPSSFPICSPQVHKDEVCWISSTQQNWIKSEFPGQGSSSTNVVKSEDLQEQNNHSSIDRPGHSTDGMLDVSSPICPLNSPWQIRRPHKSMRRNNAECDSDDKPREMHNQSVNHTDFSNSLLLSEVSESNEDAEMKDDFYSQTPPYPPVRTTSRGAIAYHTLSHLTRNNNVNSHHSRPLSLPQSFHATNELYSTLCRTDSSNECIKFLTDSIHEEHITSQADNQNIHKNLIDMTPEICQDCFLSSSYDILSKYINQQQSPSEESLWWYHPVHQKRRRRRKVESKKHTEDKPTHRRHPHQLQQQHHMDGHIMSVSEKSSDLSSPIVNKPDSGYIETLINKVENNYTVSDSCKRAKDNDFPVNDGPPNLQSFLNNKLAQKEKREEKEERQQEQQCSEVRHKNFKSQINSPSDLSWDQELLCLSHDRLVAYFAEMKESNA